MRPTLQLRALWPRKFFAQLTLIELVLLACLLPLQLFLFSLFWNVMEEHASQVVSWDLARDVAHDLEESAAEQTSPLGSSTGALLGDYAIANQGCDIFLVDDLGKVLFSSTGSRLPAQAAVDLSVINRFLESDDSALARIFGRNPVSGTSQLISAARIEHHPRVSYVYVTLPSETSHSFAEMLSVPVPVGSGRFPAWLVLVSLISASGILSIAYLRNLTWDFRRLKPMIEHFARGEFQHRAQSTSDTEIGRQISALNLMAEAIETNMQQLEKKDRLQRELVSDISHDIRGPVTLIRGYGEELMHAPDLDSNKWRDFLDTIRGNIASLRELHANLSDLALLEEGELVPKLGAVPVQHLFEELRSRFGLMAEKLGIMLTITVQEGRALHVVGDQVLLSRALANLVENALRYTPKGGEVELRGESHGDNVTCAVRNSGAEIKGADIPMLFERGYQVDDEPSARRGAGGLGLAIVNGIMVMHGTEMRVVSDNVAGTVFFFTLPRAHIGVRVNG